MGWTYTSDYRGGGVRAYLDAHFESENDAGKWEILDSALVQMRRYYAAMRWTNKTKGEVRTLALVCLVNHVPRASDGYTLGWKDMSEDMEPVAIDCPLRILDRLDPPASDHARKWREDVRTHHARRRTRPKVGDIFTLAAPMTFTDGSVEHRFRAERYGKRGIGHRGLTTGTLYRIARISTVDFTIESEPATEAGSERDAPTQTSLL